LARSGGVDVLSGRGDGTFALTNRYSVGKLGPAVLADLNGDGRLDLAGANVFPYSVTVLLGNGNGSFQSAPSLTATVPPTSLVAADLDGDGHLDLAVGSILVASMFLGDGMGGFRTGQEIRTGLHRDSERTLLAVGDIDRDGHADLLASVPGSSQGVSFLPGNGD